MRPIFEMAEMSQMAKTGVSNILGSMGYKPKIDELIRGFSGNEYRVSVWVPTPSGALIVDQMMLSTDMLIPWLRLQMPKTFESSKVTIADFFKYIDVSMGLEGRPSIYWLHNYEIHPQLAKAVGFNVGRIAKEFSEPWIASKGEMTGEDIEATESGENF